MKMIGKARCPFCGKKIVEKIGTYKWKCEGGCLSTRGEIMMVGALKTDEAKARERSSSPRS